MHRNIYCLHQKYMNTRQAFESKILCVCAIKVLLENLCTFKEFAQFMSYVKENGTFHALSKGEYVTTRKVN